MEKIQIQTQDLYTVGNFFNFGTNSPLVICSHGFASSKENSTYNLLTKLLSEFQISSFCYDFYGHGESSGKIEYLTTTKAIQNLQSVYRYFWDNGYRKIGLVGSSFGGFVSLLCAPDWKDLLFLALKCPVSDFLAIQLERRTQEELEKWKSNGFILYKLGENLEFKLNYSFFEDLTKDNGYTRASQIQVPTLIVHGSKDESVPLLQSQKLKNLIPNSILEIIQGADHRFSNHTDFDRMVSLILEFILKNIK